MVWNKGIPRTEEEKEKMRKGITPEERQRRSDRIKARYAQGKYEFMKGETNPSCNPEVGRKIAEANRKRVQSEETREKIRQARLGKPGPVWSEEQRKGCSERMKKNNPMYDLEVIKRHPSFQKGNQNPSKGERVVEKMLKDMGLSYEQQYPIKNLGPKHYFLDFYLPDFNACIEYDGFWTHAEEPEKDQERDAFVLKTYGIRTFRILEKDINNTNKPGLVNRIWEFLNGSKICKDQVSNKKGPKNFGLGLDR